MRTRILFFFTFCAFVNASILKHHIVLRSNDNAEESADDSWWKTAVFYQIYPRSFKDSDGDGYGDLQGIIQKLGHLNDMGVSAAWLSPIYKSPGVDQGYDISDYRDIDPLFGTLDDLKELITKAHKLGIKIIMDFVPNHTSDEHVWFKKSRRNDTEYRDYYIWRDAVIVGGNNTAPNNWVSAFGGSAWEWDKTRQQYYLRQFSSAQPDLNYRNKNVVAAMKDILTYWLDFGTDGFRMDAVPFLFEDDEFRDEPLSGASGVDSDGYGYLKHIYTNNLDETYDMIYQFRQVLDDYNKNASYTRIMMTEAYTDTEEKTVEYYGSTNGSADGGHFTFNFNFITDLSNGFVVDDLIRTINKWLSIIPKRYVSNWVLGNHDQHRIATRVGVGNTDAFNMIAAFLPGVQVTYNGEEIGMEDGEVTCKQGLDPQATNCSTFNETSRDFERTPFQWDDTLNAGFSDNKNGTWLPVSEKYLSNNLQAQNQSGISSHYNVYKSLIQFRKNFKNISYDAVSLIKVSDNVLQIVRVTDKGEYIYLFNAGNKSEKVQIFTNPGSFKVIVSSVNSTFEEGNSFSETETLEAHESVILEFSPNTPPSGSNTKYTAGWLVLIVTILAAMHIQ